ncbi:MAG TPA: glycosyltransferase [Pyrinomonadaceae bacterium]|nr:glycosyltransferase [Pyrinomonadaceae bacterium]
MKVVRIIARLNVGGPARHVAWLTAATARAGIDSVLVAGTVPPGEDDMTSFALAQGVEPRIIPEMSREVSPKDAVTVWKLFRLYLRERPDIVHTHTAKAGTVGRAAGLLYRWLTPSALILRPRPCRFVHTYHGHIFHSYYGPLKTRLFLLIEKLLARLATDRIVVISPRQLGEIHEEFGVGRRRQFAVVPLGLDLRVFDNWAERRHVLRSELGAADDDVLVGIVGRLTEVKNHELFLASAARYVEMQRAGEAPPDRRVRFLVIGDGHLRRELEERALLATDVGGVGDLLGAIDGAELRRGARAWRVCERGVLVRARDAEAFAEGLAHLVGREELRAQMGARGREFVERRHSKERLASDVIALYEELTGAGARHARSPGEESARERARAGGSSHPPDASNALRRG